jgi:hypothetical protein
MINAESGRRSRGLRLPDSAFYIHHSALLQGVPAMANDPKNVKADKDDVRQANEEGDPQASGRVRGHVANEGEGADRTNPDAPRKHGQGKQDPSVTTPHRESGDRA